MKAPSNTAARRAEHAMQPEAKAPENHLTVVGLPAAGMAELGASAIEALAKAEVVIGSWRQLNLVDCGNAEKKPWPSPLRPSIVPMFEKLRGRRVVVLGSGDPMFHGIGTTLHAVLEDWSIDVIPHASSVSLACARLGWAAEHTPVYSLTTHSIEGVLVHAERNQRFLVLGADEASPEAICDVLHRAGVEAEVSVLSDLGSSDEQIRFGTAAQPPEVVSSLNIIALSHIRAPHAASLAPGLSDDSFEHDGQISKRYVRALTVSAIAPMPGEHLWDIGGGSGSVTIECLRLEPSLRATVFEADDERRQRILRNAHRFGVSDRLVVVGAAPGAFDQAPQASVVFVGGGLTQEGMWPQLWAELPAGVRVVANAVTVESLAMLIDLQQRHGGELATFQVSSQHPVGSFHAFKPALPVTQWTVQKGNHA
ncbi:precorrin-6y C5,15-methyltransferase (decarboxylating) subunit CbiE [Corynebacterium gerontici]|uniref:Precorrin-6Y C(5,15)-methyltransferase [decarboxylating] n=1 Tax=Corynebacterium gerontici TaxID=2079234 RepID=A0A3G6J0D2_9CORY|nr:precorrin-6y C5,15-methyltransferase (decarboxylating) subunit CbiE [Corynebacterium gerontici]AZA11412.1 Precorrin-6Y C(5,15)-methyltransferase [decarboxylating] [Corynebacterium gerontici]